MTAAMIERWLAPIGESDPVGPDPRALAAYQSVRDEVGRLESPSAGACRWELVERDAGSVLLASKDLGAASYLAGALAHRRGLEGLVLGTSLLASLIGRFDALHPVRPRARAGALAWYLERAESLAAATPVSAGDRGHVLAWQEALAALDAAARARLGPDAPSLHRLNESAERLAMTVPAAAPTTATTAPTASATPEAAPPAAATPSVAAIALIAATASGEAPVRPAPALPPAVADAPSDPARVAGYLTQLGASLVAAARTRRGAVALDPEAIRLLLAGLFLPVGRAPVDGAMPPPPPALRADLSSLHAIRDPVRAVEMAALAVEKQRFWIDAHHALQQALEAAGPALAALHASELRALLARLPELLDRTFSDGSPFASADARAWAASLITPASAGSPAAAGDDTGSVVLREAREALRSGDARGALARAQHAVHLANDARARFAARLEVAQLGLDARSAALALAIAAELLREASARGLAEWDPELEARACALYLRAASAEKSALPIAIAEVHARLCVVDPAAAIGISRT